MWLQTVTFIGLILGVSSAGHLEMNPIPPSPIPTRAVEPVWKAPEKYLDIRRHDVVSRDHGCTDFPDDIEQSYHCVDIWLKNRFSESSTPTRPSYVFTEFEYHHSEHSNKYSWKPVVTWVEDINPWRIRACAAAPGGMKGALNEGKMRWFAVYSNIQQTNVEQVGVWNAGNEAVTTASRCYRVTFPIAFAQSPIINLQMKLKSGLMSSEEAMTIWAKDVSSTGMDICIEEFYAWSRYHHEFEIHWYGIASSHVQDNYALHNKAVFAAGDQYPADHTKLNSFYCKNVTIPKLYPCPAILVQPVIPDKQVCESAVVGWVAYQFGDMATLCYADKRGFSDKRKTNVELHYILYGHSDPCNAVSCSARQTCVHPTWNTGACGCVEHCPEDGEEACGTNMKTYRNRCQLDKEACESGFKFEYAHYGKCEKHTFDHGRVQLVADSICQGLYCAVVSTRNNIWYPAADINVQISVNWMNDINGPMPTTHDASSSWIENLTPTSFKACVMEAGRRTLVKAPSINWFAYQGMMKDIMSHRIEVGEWRSGTHCVPAHRRTVMEKSIDTHPPICPDVEDDDKSEEEKKWQYNSHVMSRVYGQHQNEWLKRIMKGYGVKKMNFTHGMKLKGATLMLTVEHTEAKTRSKKQDSVNVWMEYDAASEEAYVCLREMSNWDGVHKGIHVHWTFFNDSMIHGVGFSHKLMFKPMPAAPQYSNYAFCQTKPYLPANFSLVDSATVIVSLQHVIPPHAAFESMKKYHLYQKEVMKGMSMGEFEFNKKEVQPSWMMPHMWRANLTGWRPHMRINKNTDHSVWIEGMNNTHIRVCQKSLYSNYHYEGVMVSMIVLPDRCKSDYRYFNGKCGKHVATCTARTTAQTLCTAEGGYMALPENERENYWLSYLASQGAISLAKSDAAQEGTWINAYGNPHTSNYSRWVTGFPSNVDPLNDCSVQGGRSNDFREIDQPCSTCNGYVCEQAAPYLSCKFRERGYCNEGECMHVAPMQYQCKCEPPYSGTRCEIKS